MFQFTHPGGVRLIPRRPELLIRDVSIHAPGRGATRFNPFRLLAYQFQFTHPGGVRLSLVFGLLRKERFNSRTREGCDSAGFPCLHSHLGVSIHAPGRGATLSRWTAGSGGGVSIHAPGRGATVAGASIGVLPTVSIHAPGRGATCVCTFVLPRCTVSIHAPGRGATTP